MGPGVKFRGAIVDRDRQAEILERVRDGKLAVDQALVQLRAASIERLGFATLDLERARRRGFPEVVYGEGKTTEQIVTIVERIHAAHQTVLVTRTTETVHAAVKNACPSAEFHPSARAVVVRQEAVRPARPGVLLLSAGTADLPIAEEAALTAELMGNEVQRIHDVGIAGLHRLLSHGEELAGARAIVVVAGMEGALPGLVAGLTDCPVIGVPTDVGYGVAQGGRAALMTMLSSCAAGLTVVNVNNGFGAGYAAGLINRL